jgi:hypothetical protein
MSEPSNSPSLTEDPLKLEELTARLRIDPQFAKDLLQEMATQATKEYLSISELARRLSWEEKTVKNKMEEGIFQKGVHYFNPRGIRPRFKWSAIVAWLEETDRQAKQSPVGSNPQSGGAIPMARGYLLGEPRLKKIVGGS